VFGWTGSKTPTSGLATIPVAQIQVSRMQMFNTKKVVDNKQAQVKDDQQRYTKNQQVRWRLG
jgi:hypothetical protein